MGNIAGTDANWYKVREDLKAIINHVGAPTLFFTFSSADMHWPELHDLFQMPTHNKSSKERRMNVINNPHIVDWFFTQKLESFVKHWLYETRDATVNGIGLDMNIKAEVASTVMVLLNCPMTQGCVS